MSSYTEKTLKWLREERGLQYAEKTEYWNCFANVRHDLFNFVDILALQVDVNKKKISGKFIGVQSTSIAGRHSHLIKIKSIPAARLWVAIGGIIWLVCWKKGKKGEDICVHEEIDFEEE